LELPTHPEIAYFYCVCEVDENVVQFDVAMDDVFAVDVFQSFDDLFEYDFRGGFV
jgi:hypothetical protein